MNFYKYCSVFLLVIWFIFCVIHSKMLGFDLSDLEMKHIFGPDYLYYSEKYSVHYPSKTLHSNGSYLITVPYNGVTYQFLAYRQNDLFGPGFHAIYRNGDFQSKLETSLENQNCVYRGSGISHKNVHLSVVGCYKNLRGVMTLENGDVIFINPAPNRYSLVANNSIDTSRPHIIHKRNAPEFEHAGTLNNTDDVGYANRSKVTCLFDSNILPLANSERVAPPERLAVINRPLTVEIGVFVDDRLWDHFKDIYGKDADRELQDFIVATVNNINLLYNHHTIDPKTNMKIVRYEVMKSSPAVLAPNAHRNGDVDLLLDAFCLYQQNLNSANDADPKHWDHALLFTGYDLYRGSVTSVAGYAPVKGMCSGIRSCTINEGMDFGSIFVITHEMGHSLGMYHDGDNGCDSACCIMSPSLGNGKTQWSHCSAREFNVFFNALGTGEMPPQCLLDGADDPVPIDFTAEGILPGQRYNLDQQCRTFHGDCWHHELRESQVMQDVCEMVWCGEGEGIIRTAHPALEGTSCGTNKWCIQGKCEPFGRIVPLPVHGAWAAWNDFPKKDCGGECSACQIDGQIRVRRSVRLCEKPAPNFGGESCQGSAYRGTACGLERCRSSVSASQYAIEKCNSFKAKDSSTPGDLSLSGSGFQYAEAPCKVWCQVASSGFIRAISSFPDGTSCGINKFCVKGECMTLSCNGKTLVASQNDCPTGTTASAVLSSVDVASGTWSTWSFWSVCTKTCGLGLRSRSRQCHLWTCPGSSVQSVPCNIEPCQDVNDWTDWSPWSICSLTCGNGLKNRQRICRRSICYGTSIEQTPCFNRPCFQRLVRSGDNQGPWQQWSTWSSCSTTCGNGTQFRERKCIDKYFNGCVDKKFVYKSCINKIPCNNPSIT